MNKKFKEYSGLNLPKVADEILDYWKSEAISRRASLQGRGTNRSSFLKDLRQPMVCPAFIM